MTDQHVDSWILRSVLTWQGMHQGGKRSIPAIGPKKEERDYITEEQVRHVRNQRPVSSHLLRKYQYQYQQCLQHEIIGIARSSNTVGILV
jgi:hypothetical protein